MWDFACVNKGKAKKIFNNVNEYVYNKERLHLELEFIFPLVIHANILYVKETLICIKYCE